MPQCPAFVPKWDSHPSPPIRALRREIPDYSVEFEAALRELFAQADEADLPSELVAHVVEYLEARDRSVQKGYGPFRLVRGGG